MPGRNCAQSPLSLAARRGSARSQPPACEIGRTQCGDFAHFRALNAVPRISDWNCIRKLFATAPPSRAGRADGYQSRPASLPARHRLISNRLQRRAYNVVSVHPTVRPKIAPRAYGSQYGAPSPEMPEPHTHHWCFALWWRNIRIVGVVNQLHLIAQPLNGCACINTAPSNA